VAASALNLSHPPSYIRKKTTSIKQEFFVHQSSGAKSDEKNFRRWSKNAVAMP